MIYAHRVHRKFTNIIFFATKNKSYNIPMTYIILFLVIIVVAIILYKYYNNTSIIGGLQRLLILTQAPWLDAIKSGKKKIEVRVGKPDFYTGHIGKLIKVGVPGGEKIKAKLAGVKHYNTLSDLISGEGAKNIIPGAKSEKDVLEQYLSIKDSKGTVVYEPGRITEKGGVVALSIELI